MGLSHRGAHRGRHGGAKRTSCAERAQNERTTSAVRFGWRFGAVRLAVRCAVLCCSAGGLSFSGCGSVRLGVRLGVRLVGVLRLLPRRTCPHPTTADVPPSPRRLRFGWRLADAPPSSLGGSLGGWRGARAPRTRATEPPRAMPERPE